MKSKINLLTCVITWKVPDLSSMTWSCWLSSWNPGMPLANSTTSLTAGVKHWEKDSQISWLVRSAPDTGHALRGQAWEDKRHRIINWLPSKILKFCYNLLAVLTSTLAPGANFHGQEGWFWALPAVPTLLWLAEPWRVVLLDWSWFWLADTR